MLSSNSLERYSIVCSKCSELTTKLYSTSFTLGIKSLASEFHSPIYAIYGFVRFADEIVDTFDRQDKNELLAKFKDDTYRAIQNKISLNPILHSFQRVVNEYHIEKELIETFLQSMEMDLSKKEYTQSSYEKYILGSAEVVGLMCLRVFCKGDKIQYEHLKLPAMRLGSAFQKINFLRDLKADYIDLGRTYFPGLEMNEFNENAKSAIEKDIEQDFRDGYTGIKSLPKGARLGVYVAYVYYYALFKKIKKTSPQTVLKERIRIPNIYKYLLIVRSLFKHSFNLI
jgi:phytoene/squalene synthetase